MLRCAVIAGAEVPEEPLIPESVALRLEVWAFAPLEPRLRTTAPGTLARLAAESPRNGDTEQDDGVELMAHGVLGDDVRCDCGQLRDARGVIDSVEGSAQDECVGALSSGAVAPQHSPMRLGPGWRRGSANRSR